MSLDQGIWRTQFQVISKKKKSKISWKLLEVQNFNAFQVASH